MTIGFDRFEALTFDCYGTLIDWETGIVDALGGLLRAHGVQLSDDDILEAYARHETRIEAGPFRRYREVLMEVGRAVSVEHGVTASEAELAAFGGSVADWPAFADSADALVALAARFRLGVITNCDDDLFAASNRQLRVDFDAIVTAQQMGSYKPALANFEAMFERLDLPRDRILHVAQSLYHDHVPAKKLGLTTVWVDRRQGIDGFGATPPADISPDLTVPNMATLADLATAGWAA